MAFVIADRVRESSTTTGTGNFTLGGAVTGYQTFDAVLDSGDTTYYTIADQGGANWEVGIGTFTSPSTLARTTILSSSNGGSIVTFTAGTKDVFISLPASKTNTNDQPNVISVNSTSNALRITQTGTGNALVVEDSANPDATPFVVDASGRVLIGADSAASSSLNLSIFNVAVATTPAVADFYKNRGGAIVSSGDGVGRIRFYGYDGASYLEAARIDSLVDGTPGTNDMPGNLRFLTTADGASSVTERMRIDSAGDVGIGTSNPTARLNVVDNTSQDAVRITQTGAGNALVVEDAANPDATPFVVDAGGIVIVGATVASSNIQDITNIARSPQFQIQGNSVASAAGTIINWSSTAGSAPSVYFAKSKSGTRGTQGVVASGDVAGLLQFNGDDGTNFVPAAAISAAIDGTPGTNDMPGRLVFSTTADGASSPTERLRIDSSGNVGIGTTTPTALLDVNGSVAITGTARRITGDFSNATQTNRILFQTTTSGGGTSVGAIPNATGNNSAFNAFGSPDPANSSFAQLRAGADTSEVRLTSGITGTGTYYPFTFYTGGSERLRIASAGQIGIGGANYGTSGQVLTSGGSGAAPSWATVSATGTLKNVQVFTSSGTYTRTAGVTTAVVIAVGGGGGGKGANGSTAGGNGGNGGTTSFGAHVTALGGTGSIGNPGGAGGTGGTGATIAIPGQGGGVGFATTGNGFGGIGGGQGGGRSSNNAAGTAGSRGGGGSGGGSFACGVGEYGGGGGGQGETSIDYITTVGATETVTIGAGGTAGTGSSAGGAGGAGYIIVYEYS